MTIFINSTTNGICVSQGVIAEVQLLFYRSATKLNEGMYYEITLALPM